MVVRVDNQIAIGVIHAFELRPRCVVIEVPRKGVVVFDSINPSLGQHALVRVYNQIPPKHGQPNPSEQHGQETMEFLKEPRLHPHAL